MAGFRFVLANKPAGINTHRVSPEKPGFAEWLEKKLEHTIHIAHRLDKETTGAMIFGRTTEEARHLTELFTDRKIQKTYLFITDRKPRLEEWTITSVIEKEGKALTSRLAEPKLANSETHFRRLKTEGPFSLIEARPQSGKTHQIRLHARDSQIPLLSDITYGGTPYPTFFLHSLLLESDDKEISHSVKPPLIFENLDLLSRPHLVRWLMSYDRRGRLYPDLVNDDGCVRLIHDEGTPLRVDKLGDVAYAGWWHESSPDHKEMDDIGRFFHLIGLPKWFLLIKKKLKTQDSNILANFAPPVWQGRENGALFEFKPDVGHAPGLFLDQRDHRRDVSLSAQGKSVLNLFAYTGGFSVMAALGGASRVTTVDLSKKYIDWAKANFRLNKLEGDAYKFYDMDSLDFLKYAAKKNISYDLIICDPPSFSRNKGKTFQIDRDFKLLITAMNQVLSPQGRIHFSTNFENWNWNDWLEALEPLCEAERLKISPQWNWQWDFEAEPYLSLMKAFHLKKEVIA